MILKIKLKHSDRIHTLDCIEKLELEGKNLSIWCKDDTFQVYILTSNIEFMKVLREE